MMVDLNDIKRDLFFKLMEAQGRVFIHARPSEFLEIGRRGLVGDELKSGITLVLNSLMKFDWGPAGLEVTLVFGSSPEKCFVPSDDIDAVYSPELNVQLIMDLPHEDMEEEDSQVKAPEPEADKTMVTEAEGNIIKVDFTRGH